MKFDAIATSLRTDPDLAADVRFYAERYLEHRRLAATHILGYNLAWAYAAWGRDLARLLGDPTLCGRDLADAAEAVVAILDAEPARIAALAGPLTDLSVMAIAYCVYGPDAPATV